MPRRPDRISPGQLAALRLAADGYTARQIATRLRISEAAVHLRIKGAIHTLGARNRVHAVMLAARAGMINLADVQAPAQQPAAATRESA